MHVPAHPLSPAPQCSPSTVAGFCPLKSGRSCSQASLLCLQVPAAPGAQQAGGAVLLRLQAASDDGGPTALSCKAAAVPVTRQRGVCKCQRACQAERQTPSGAGHAAGSRQRGGAGRDSDSCWHGPHQPGAACVGAAWPQLCGRRPAAHSDPAASQPGRGSRHTLAGQCKATGRPSRAIPYTGSALPRGRQLPMAGAHRSTLGCSRF